DALAIARDLRQPRLDVGADALDVDAAARTGEAAAVVDRNTADVHVGGGITILVDEERGVLRGQALVVRHDARRVAAGWRCCKAGRLDSAGGRGDSRAVRPADGSGFGRVWLVGAVALLAVATPLVWAVVHWASSSDPRTIRVGVVQLAATGDTV